MYNSMALVDWYQYSENSCVLKFYNMQITEMNWDNAPRSVRWVDLSSNRITKMNWKNVPEKLVGVCLSSNQIEEIVWEGSPPSLTWISLGNNKITKINWKNAPPNLYNIDLSLNPITEMEWKNCPRFINGINLSACPIRELHWGTCRNEFISSIYPSYLYVYYENLTKSKDFIPYLPLVSDTLKELHYELESIWWRCPDGVRFKEDLKSLQNSGYFL